jgi:hypothetical protein
MPHPARRGRHKGPVDLVELLSSREGESHRIMLEDSECEIVLRHEDVDRRSQEILARYRVPADRSRPRRTPAALSASEPCGRTLPKITECANPASFPILSGTAPSGVQVCCEYHGDRLRT